MRIKFKILFIIFLLFSFGSIFAEQYSNPIGLSTPVYWTTAPLPGDPDSCEEDVSYGYKKQKKCELDVRGFRLTFHSFILPIGFGYYELKYNRYYYTNQFTNDKKLDTFEKFEVYKIFFPQFAERGRFFLGWTPSFTISIDGEREYNGTKENLNPSVYTNLVYNFIYSFDVGVIFTEKIVGYLSYHSIFFNLESVDGYHDDREVYLVEAAILVKL